MKNCLIKKPTSYIRLILLSALLITQANAQPIVPLQKWATKNGAQVYFVQTHELPIVDIRVIVEAGSARDGKQQGMANLVNALLETGTVKNDANDIAETFEKNGAHYSTSVKRDFALLSLRSLTEPHLLAPSVELLHAILTTPSFPPEQLKRLKKQSFQALKAQQQDPAAVTYKTFLKKLYRAHPYGHPVLGSVQSLQAITVDDLLKFYNQYYCAKNIKLILVGNMDQKQAKTLAEQILKGLPPGQKAPKIPFAKMGEKATQATLRFPSQQSHVLMGQIGIHRGDPDYFALTVGNHILGGGALTSRLFKQIRDQRGLAYSVYSFFSLLKARGPFLTTLQTRHDKVREAVHETHRLIKAFVQNGPDAREVQAAKQHISGRFLVALASNADITDHVVKIAHYELPLDYLDTFRDHINQVTQQQIKKAFKDHVHPDQMLTLVLGQ